MSAARRSLFREHLLIVLRMHLVAGLQLRKLQVIVARFIQIARLHMCVRQQFIYFGDISALARFVEKLEQSFKRLRIIPYVSDQRSKAFQQPGLVRA